MKIIPMRRKHVARALAVSLLFACAAPTFVAAEVRLTGTLDQLVLEAKNATMPEILSGIQSALNCKIVLRGSTNRQFTGTYSGSLRRVLTRLLDGANYVMSPDRNEINIVLLGADGSRSGLRVAQAVIGAPAANRPAAGDETSSSDVQGWTGRPAELPPRPPAPATASPSATAEEPPAASDIQGWTGRPTELPPRPRALAVASVVAAAAEPAENSDTQGWTGRPSELPSRRP